MYVSQVNWSTPKSDDDLVLDEHAYCIEHGEPTAEVAQAGYDCDQIRTAAEAILQLQGANEDVRRDASLP
jgi:hypothetical protein